MNDKKTHIAVSNGTQPVSLFEDQKIRMAWDAEKEEWYFSIVDVVGVLTDSIDPTVYWRKLKQRLKAEGNETVTKCHGLKMTASDGKKRLTDVADTEQLLRIIQSVPSKKLSRSSCGWLRSAENASRKLSIRNRPSIGLWKHI